MAQSKMMTRYMQLKEAATYLASPIFYFCKPTFTKNVISMPHTTSTRQPYLVKEK